MDWRTVASAQHGVLTRAQLETVGLTRSEISSLLRRGEIVAMPKRGVLQVAASPATQLSECWAAGLATRGAISHTTAARIWRLDLPASDSALHVTVARRIRTRVPLGVKVHRVALSAEAVTQHNGLAITTRGRTVLDCLGMLRFSDARTLFDRALQRHWIRPGDIVHRLAQERGRWGNQQIRRLWKEATEGDAESERRLHELLRAAAITGWRPNVPVDLGFATLTVDVLFDAARLIIEVDGWAHHWDVERFASDRARQNALVNAGWTVLRFTAADVRDRPRYVIASVSTALRRRDAA